MAEMTSKETGTSQERPSLRGRRGVLPVGVLVVAVAIGAGIGVSVAQTRAHLRPAATCTASSKTVVCVKIASVKVNGVAKAENILVNGKGFALYRFAPDPKNGSVCGPSAGCAPIWPPLLVPKGAKVEGGAGVTGLTTFTRKLKPLGTQVAYQGHALYTFVSDTKPLVATGNNVMKFFVVPVKTTTAACTASSKTVVCVKIASVNVSGMAENILVNGGGFTLYHRASDPKGGSSCTGGCATAWPPLLVPTGAKVEGGKGVTGLTTFKRSSPSGTQVAYKGEALYTWQGDTKPGQATGQGIGGFAVVPDGSTPPSTTTTRCTGYYC